MNATRKARSIRWAMGVTATALIIGSAVYVQARDRGVNQPGAAGNHPTAVGVAVVGGSAAQNRAVVDAGTPGVGAPGVGVTPGPGVGAPGVGATDPGKNQPGAAGNRH